MPSLPAGLRAGRYELLAKLAIGGMGEVFVARQLGAGSFEKRLAVKLLLPHLVADAEFVQLFLDEARIAARMNHPNIVQIFDVGEADGRPFIAMALMEGVSLSRLLKCCQEQQLAIPLPIARLVAVGLCDGLGYAHSLKDSLGRPDPVIHRDVSPSNVLVSTAGAVVLTDFGIAKARGSLHHTQVGDVKGKWAYMAPEQMAQRPVDARTDLFSASATLFELFTGASPFVQEVDPATHQPIRKLAWPEATSLRPEVGSRVSSALNRGLNPDRHARFPSARELRDALVDGPVALPNELGEFVSNTCGRVLPSKSYLGAGEERPTRSAVPEAATVRDSPDGRGRLLLRLVVALGFALGLALAGAFLGWGAFSPRQSTPAVPVAEAEAAKPPPTPPELPRPSAVLLERTRAAEPFTVPPRRREKAATNPTPVRMGFLNADATPWAQVFLGTRELERTPLSRYPLPVGRHTLEFRNPDLGKVERRTVVVEEGKTVTLRVRFSP